MKVSPHPLRRWTRQEYEQMITTGLIRDGERVELIDGEIRTMAAQGDPHVAAVHLAAEALKEAFGHGYAVRTQAPIPLDPTSAPEPDVAVVPGALADYWDRSPTQFLLVVEVAATTLKEDRRDKGSLYARGGVQDYWIVNLVNNVLEVHRDPIPDAKAPFGWKYRLVQRFQPGEHVSPLAKPEAVIPVASFLRPR